MLCNFSLFVLRVSIFHNHFILTSLHNFGSFSFQLYFFCGIELDEEVKNTPKWSICQ